MSRFEKVKAFIVVVYLVKWTDRDSKRERERERHTHTHTHTPTHKERERDERKTNGKKGMI